MWVSDDAGYHFEVATPIDPFDGGEISTRDGPGSVQLLFALSFKKAISNRVTAIVGE